MSTTGSRLLQMAVQGLHCPAPNFDTVEADLTPRATHLHRASRALQLDRGKHALGVDWLIVKLAL